MRMKIIAILCFLQFGIVFSQINEDLICAEKNRIINRIQKRGISNIHHGFEINYHRCHWYLNPIKNAYLKGRVLFQFRVVDKEDSLGFDLISGLKINSISYHGTNMAFSRKGDAVYVKKAGGWQSNDQDSFEVDYEGFPANNNGFGAFIYDNHKTGPVIHTLSEPYGALSWWPCKQTLHDKIDSIDIYVHTDKSLKAGSNGLLVETIQEGDTNHIYHWKHRYPIVTYLVAMVVTNYDEFTQYAHLVGRTDSLPVLNYVFPQFTASAYKEIQQVLPQIRLFDSLFVRYPFVKEKYGHAQFTWGGGMEHQTMSFMVNFSFDLMAHELAHQWFGDMVTCGTWRDLWLNEGFATYLTCLAFEYLKGPESAKDRLRGMRNDITGDPNGAVCPADTSQVNVLFNGRLTYNKGAWVLHQLRKTIGDSAFFAGCRNYLSGANAYGFGNTAGLKKYMEQASGKNLAVYFQRWFYGEGFPYLKINWKQRGSKVSVSVEQTPSNMMVPIWYIKVPMLFKNKTQSQLFVWEPQNLKENYEIELPFSADTAIFDPNVTVLAKASVGGINVDLIQQEEIVIAPNPGRDLASVFCRNSNMTKIQIFNSVGQDIFSVDYGNEAQKFVDLNTSKWSTGAYIIRIYAGNLVYSKKWLKY